MSAITGSAADSLIGVHYGIAKSSRDQWTFRKSEQYFGTTSGLTCYLICYNSTAIFHVSIAGGKMQPFLQSGVQSLDRIQYFLITGLAWTKFSRHEQEIPTKRWRVMELLNSEWRKEVSLFQNRALLGRRHSGADSKNLFEYAGGF
jgi:hypothetical protein